MKLTKEKLKQLIKEEIEAIIEQEDAPSKEEIIKAVNSVDVEAQKIADQLKKAAETSGQDFEMLKSLLIQSLQNQKA